MAEREAATFTPQGIRTQQMLRFVTEIYPEIYPVCFGLREPNRAIAAVKNSLALLKSEGHLRNPLK